MRDTTDRDTMNTTGYEALRDGSLLRTIWGRRTHRVSRGSSVLAGSMSYESEAPREPLSAHGRADERLSEKRPWRPACRGRRGD